jgi:branched-subunit amino acid ABC-type transport system permease component
MRAYSDNPSLASISGINVARIVIAVWVINGIVSALAGIFQGVVQGSFTSNMGWSLLLPIFAAVVLGTIGDVYGALLGGMTLGLAMELSQLPIFFGGVPSSYKPVVAFAALAVVLIVRPEGLLGVKARKI